MSEPYVPPRMAKLPTDHRGFPVPRFATWHAGEPDFRVADTLFMVEAVNRGLCWVCGEALGVYRCYVIGPMCAVNRTTSEPPCHRDCAIYSVQRCPFLSRPRMRRNAKDMPEHGPPAGLGLGRNPGMAVVWIEKRKAQPYRVEADATRNITAGYLFQLGDPVEVQWWAYGKPATREEAIEALDRGAPAIRDVAIAEGAVDVFDRMLAKARTYLPAQP